VGAMISVGSYSVHSTELQTVAAQVPVRVGQSRAGGVRCPGGGGFSGGACFLLILVSRFVFFFSSRRRHTRLVSDWSSDVCSSDLPRSAAASAAMAAAAAGAGAATGRHSC